MLPKGTINSFFLLISMRIVGVNKLIIEMLAAFHPETSTYTTQYQIPQLFYLFSVPFKECSSIRRYKLR